MRKFWKQNEQVYISSYDYSDHIVRIWQLNCRNNIFREWLNELDIFTKNGEFEHWIYYISANWNFIALLPSSVLYL